MDRVRFGRALGYGARAAARTAMQAAQAAAAPSPSATSPSAPSRPRAESHPANSAPRPTVLPPLRAASYAMPAARAAAAGVAGPLRQASRALWHEVTGSFFALFALSFALGTWHIRASAVSPIPNDRFRFYAFGAMALLFTYFSVSSFLRARRRD